MISVSSSLGAKKLGSQGLEVSAEGYGCMGLSAFYSSAKTITEEQAIEVIRKAYNSGITLFDTAEIYGPHLNEVLVGKALSIYPRESYRLATKTGIDVTTFKPNGKPEYIRMACERSLKNLNLSYIDLYYLHRIDTTVPIEESIEELKKLKEEGKIKYIGLSEASANTIRRAHKVHPISAVQVEWSLWTRDIEAEIIPTCRELGIGIVAYSPLGRGFLTGVVQSVTDLDENDWRRKGCPRFSEENIQQNLKFVGVVKQLAEKKGVSPGQISLAWVLSRGKDVCPIPGTSNLKHLEDNVKACQVEFTKEEVEELEKLLPPVSGERYAAGATFKDN